MSASTPSKGLGAWFSPTDSTRLGLAHLVLVAAAFLLGTGFAWLMQAEQFSPGETLIAPSVYQSLSTMHGLLLVVFCAVPALAAVFGNLLLPGFLAARELPFPRLGRLALHLHAAGLIAVLLAVFLGTVGGSWTLVPWLPLGSQLSLVLVALGLHLMAFSIGFTGLGHVAAVVVSGRSVAALPVFAGTMLIAGVLQIVAAAPLGAASLLLFVQELPGTAVFGQAVDPVDQFRLVSFFAHIAVALVVVPGIGIAAEVLAQAGRRAVYAPRLVMGSTAALAALWACGWGIRVVGFDADASGPAAASFFSLLTLVPGSLLAFAAVATLNQAALRLSSAVVYALSFAFHATLGGLASLFLANLATGPSLEASVFSTATLHYLLLGAGLSAFFAGLTQAWPRLVGRRIDETKGMLAAALVFAGIHFTFLPSLMMGAQGLPPRLYDFPAELLSLQRFATVGSWVLALGLVIAAWTFLQSWTSGRAVESSAPVEGASPLGEV